LSISTGSAHPRYPFNPRESAVQTIIHADEADGTDG